MRIDNLNITNKYISFTEQKIAFDKKGIYLISGENGSGKTTVIKQLIFGKNRISFNNREQEEAYINDRSGLFAYVPQNIIIPDITVGKYLNKENQIDAGSSLLLAERLGLSVDAKQKMKLLSGGEKEKLAIAAALQKNTPYIILDEPTNNLDDQSTEILCGLLEEYSENKTIIIVSHDVRVKFNRVDVNYVEICGHEIIEHTNNGEYNCEMPQKINKKSAFAFAGRFQLNIYNVLSHLFFLCIMAFIVYINYLTCDTYISESHIPKPGSVMQYVVEGMYPNVNEPYVNSKKLVIANDKRMQTLTFECVEKLFDMEYCQEMFVFDENYFESNLSEFSRLEGENFSVPEFIWDSYRDNLGFDFFWKIIKGRVPKDNAAEIVLDEKSALDLTGMSNVEEALNRVVEVYDKQYMLVGICDAPISWVSYNDYEEGCFYKYDAKTWDAFQKKAADRQESVYLKKIVPQCFFVTDNEAALLDYLVINYPASDYYSAIYARQSMFYNNKNLYIKMIVINMVQIVLVGILLICLMMAAKKNDINLLVDMGNYHISRDKYRNIYFISKILARIISIVMVILFAIYISDRYLVNIYLIAIYCMLLLCFETLMVYLLIIKKVKARC